MSTLPLVEDWTITASCGRCSGRGYRLWGGSEHRTCDKCNGTTVVVTDVRKLSANVQDVILAFGAMGMSERHRAPFTPNEVANFMGVPWPRTGDHGSGNVARQMAPATRITPALTGLRARGLVWCGRRRDGLSGTAYDLTAEGEAARDLILRWRAEG